jgi:hypothetical protein
MNDILKTGDQIAITFEGRTVGGRVEFASSNGKSVMISFEAILGGFVGMMPVSREDDGTYTLVFGGAPIVIKPRVTRH